MKKYLVLLAVPLLVVLTACQNQSHEAKPEIVTSFYPMYAFTKAIVGDQVQVENIMPSSQDVHEFEPSAQEIAKMSQAKALVYNDNDLEKWASKVQTSGKKIEAAQNVKQISNDPHTWLSPKEAIIEVNEISKGLQAEFPQYKATFAKNTAAYVKKLQALSDDYQHLSDSKTKIMITQHDAFSYLARDYGLTDVPIAGIDPEEEPSSQALIKLRQEMKKNNVKYVYSEQNSSSKLADTLARNTGAKLIELNTLEAVTTKQEENGANYLNIMEENLKTLESTLN